MKDKITSVVAMKKTDLNISVDISKYWQTDENGEMKSVYSVYQEIIGTELEVSRYTLTRAKEGVLEKGNFTYLHRLSRLCSLWSGKSVSVEDIFSKSENFNKSVAA